MCVCIVSHVQIDRLCMYTHLSTQTIISHTGLLSLSPWHSTSYHLYPWTLTHSSAQADHSSLILPFDGKTSFRTTEILASIPYTSPSPSFIFPSSSCYSFSCLPSSSLLLPPSLQYLGQADMMTCLI